MRLDWKLIRTILAYVESETLDTFLTDVKSLSEWKEGQLLSERLGNNQDSSQRIVLKHVQLLVNGGYLEGVSVRCSLDGYYSYALSSNPSLTLNGYSLLESLRTDNYIEKLKKYAKDKCVPLTIENVIELAKLALPALLQ